MRNGVGDIGSVLLLGGSSEIGIASVRALAPKSRILLAGRPSIELETATRELNALAPVEVLDLDAAVIDSHARVIDAAFAAGDIDVIVLAIGVLGDQDQHEQDPSVAVATATATYTGPMSLALHCARHLRTQGHGTLVVLSSVAADRPRRANFVYGSAKSGLDAFARGLDAALAGSGASVVVVRPGFVHTRMTAGRSPAPLATGPSEVGQVVARAVRRRSRIAYAPAALRPVMLALRALPEPIFRRLPMS
jgi:decaprenylphospho-beta-D-erythro-pentofuranosid-2-ulose 2-reductase